MERRMSVIDFWTVGPTAAALGLRTRGFSPQEAERLVRLKIRYERGEFRELTDHSRWAFTRWLIQHGRLSDWFPTPHELEKGGQDDQWWIRLGTITCQAPTGTTSLLAGVSSGIEPIYDFKLVRQEHPDAPLPQSFVTAGELTPEEHVRVQAKIQEFTDAAISRTVNAPGSHSVEDVKQLYQLAYGLGCKGITYYRDGSREAVLSHADQEEAPVDGLAPRPRVLAGTTYRAETPVGTAFVTINVREEGANRQPFEVFLNVGKAGSDIAGLSEAIGRLCSLCLRLPGQISARERVAAIVDQLAGIGGGHSLSFGAQRVRSLPDAVARVLAEAAGLAHDAAVYGGTPMAGSGDLCPSCGQATLYHREGCRSCPCGYSAC